MGLGDLLKRLGKGSSEGEKAQPQAPAAKTKGGRTLPPLPAYLKKDSFIRNPEDALPDYTPGVVPEMADAGSFKRPGAWLKEKLGGVTETKALNSLEKTKQALKKSGGFNDQDIQSFLNGLLDEEKPAAESAEPPSRPKPGP